MAGISDLKILFVASEVAPYAKSGGLGDVIGSLPHALKALGADVRVVFPKYKSINPERLAGLIFVDSFVTSLNWRHQNTSIHMLNNSVPTYLIENDYYFGRDGFYGYWDDDERFAFFTKAAVEFLNYIDFKPDILHFNDWQTGLGSVYLKDNYGGFTFYKDMKTVFTIHNMQYQGNFDREALHHVDLNDGYFDTKKMEFHGRISFMKAGIVYADAVTTVSNTYSREIQTAQYGYGMDGLLRAYNHKLYGILNGIDVGDYNPETDPHIPFHFNSQSMEKKKEAKHALQKELGLPESHAPIISIVSRLADQKGLDLVAVALEELMGMDIQLVVLGTGDGRYEHLFKHMAWRFPHKLSANIYFSEPMARKIYAASDMFLMPSLFEPCGLGQLIAMRYGTVPIVRQTGGLRDTVTHFNSCTREGNGFVFNDYVASGMMWAVHQGLQTYWNAPDDWQQVVSNAINSDFSWKASALRYAQLYESLTKKRCISAF